MANTWNTGVWGQNEWGDQGPVVITLPGQSTTSSVGSVVAAPIITVELTGLPTASSVASLSPTTSLILTPTSLQSHTALGTSTNPGTLDGSGKKR